MCFVLALTCQFHERKIALMLSSDKILSHSISISSDSRLAINKLSFAPSDNIMHSASTLEHATTFCPLDHQMTSAEPLIVPN